MATPSPDPIDFPPMVMLVFTTLGAAVMMITYGLGLAGPVCAILFLGAVFNGALIAYAKPVIDWVRQP